MIKPGMTGSRSESGKLSGLLPPPYSARVRQRTLLGGQARDLYKCASVLLVPYWVGHRHRRPCGIGLRDRQILGKGVERTEDQGAYGQRQVQVTWCNSRRRSSSESSLAQTPEQPLPRLDTGGAEAIARARQSADADQGDREKAQTHALRGLLQNETRGHRAGPCSEAPSAQVNAGRSISEWAVESRAAKVKILVYVAGVLGSFYAARLQAAGEDVFLLCAPRFQIPLPPRAACVAMRSNGCFVGSRLSPYLLSVREARPHVHRLHQLRPHRRWAADSVNRP
jgi:hypothetical protein